MKNFFKKTLCFTLSLLICTAVLAGIPFSAETVYDATVYVKSTGDDQNTGTTAETAVKTLKGGYAALKTALGTKSGQASANGKIVLLDSTAIEVGTKVSASDDAHPYTVTVTGATPDTAISFYDVSGGKQGYYNHLGPTVYENITLKNDKTAYNYFSLHTSSKLTFNSGITVKKNKSGYGISLGGSLQGSNASNDTEINVNSGDFRIIYVAGYTNYVNGYTATLNLNGGSAERVCGSFQEYNGNLVYNIKNATAGEIDFGPYNSSKKVGSTFVGDLTVNLENAHITGDMLCPLSPLNGDLTVNISGDTQIDGDFKPTSQKTVAVNVTLESGKTVKFTGNEKINADTVTANGGKLVLGANTAFYAETVSGTADFDYVDTPQSTVFVSAPVATADTAFNYVGSGKLEITTDSTLKKWSVTDSGEPTKGLILTAPKDVTVKLYSGFKSTITQITESKTETTGDITKHYFNNLASGKYNYKSSGTGYYTVQKNIYLSPEEAATFTTVSADPGKKTGQGFEATGTITQYTDEVEQNMLGAKEEWKTAYADAYTTPTMKEGNKKAANEFTTQSEMEETVADIKANGSNKDNMYLYNLCVTPGYNFNMPLVIFTKTDLSGVDTLQEAITEIKKNSLLNIEYEAQIHGNEPAAGEGALGIMRSLGGDYGKDVIENANVIVIPRANPDGSKAFTRNNVANGFDMNRDHIKVESKEIEALHGLYNALMPEIFIDGHEYTTDTSTTSGVYRDILFAVGGGYNSTDKLVKAGTDVTNNIISTLDNEGIRSTYYPSTNEAGAVTSALMINTANFSSGRGYYSLKGTVTLLVETRGIGMGRQSFERRVVSQYITVKALLDYVTKHTSDIITATHEEREHIENIGKTYDNNSKFSLYSGSSKINKVTLDNLKFNFSTGQQTSKETIDCYYYDKPERYRTRPTAYVMPKDAPNVQKVLDTVKKHDIYYYTVDGQVSMKLKQYTLIKEEKNSSDVLTVSEAGLTEENSVTFDNGAYVFPLNQVSGTLMMYLFEPDVTDTFNYGSSLAQSGTVAAANGYFPIYRYEHDLESDGTVYTGETELAPQGITVTSPKSAGQTGSISGLKADRKYKYRLESDVLYTTVPDGATEVTGLSSGKYRLAYADNEHASELLFSIDYPFDGVVYVDAAVGDDQNKGYSETEPVKSIQKAYENLNDGIKNSLGKSGKIVLLSNYVIDAATSPVGTQFKIIDDTNKRIIFPSSDYEITICGKTGNEIFESKYTISFASDTVIENITLKNTHTSNFRYLCGAGHKFVLGENIKATGTYRFMLVGGDYSGTTAISQIDMTVKSGEWSNIYLSHYVSGSYSGDINVSFLGGTVKGTVQLSYSTVNTGKVNITAQNTEFKGDFFLGNTGAKSKTDISSDYTVNLLQNAKLSNFYCGCSSAIESGNMTGNIDIYFNGATVTGNLWGKGTKDGSATADSEIYMYTENVTEPLYFKEVHKETSDIVLGDVNEDGFVTSDDAIYLLHYTFEPDDYPLYSKHTAYEFPHKLAAGDINGDGFVTSDDAIYLLHYTFEPTDYPLYPEKQ